MLRPIRASGSRVLAAVAIGLGAVLMGTPAAASPIVEIGGNNTVATAQLIPGSTFTLPVPGTVFDPPGSPTATVLGTGGDDDVDFYGFTVSAAGFAYFDIDNDPFTFDTMLSLFDSTGTLIGFDDDSDPPDPGTVDSRDSFLGVIALPAAGTYYLAVSQWPNFPNAYDNPNSTELVRPDGGFGGFSIAGAIPGDSSFFDNGAEGTAPYTLHLSVQNAADAVPVPEPTSLLLLGTSLAGLGARRWRQRKAS